MAWAAGSVLTPVPVCVGGESLLAEQRQTLGPDKHTCDQRGEPETRKLWTKTLIVALRVVDASRHEDVDEIMASSKSGVVLKYLISAYLGSHFQPPCVDMYRDLMLCLYPASNLLSWPLPGFISIIFSFYFSLWFWFLKKGLWAFFPKFNFNNIDSIACWFWTS